jgi:hypothetical protein
MTRGPIATVWSVSKKRGQQHKKSWHAKRDRAEPRRRPAESAHDGGTVTITARSWESLALDVPLRFPVPPLAKTIDGAEDFWWRFIEYATDIDDPTTFPAFGHAIAPAKLRVCRRYIETSKDLAGSAALNYPVSLDVHIDNAGESEDVLFDSPQTDAVVGLAGLFRQFYAPNEKASFAKVLKLLRAEAATNPSQQQTEQMRQLDAWQGAEGVTRNRSLNNQAIKRLVADGRAPNDPDLERYPDAAPPDQTISDYFYGDHLHWDSKADVVEERERSPFLDGLFRYEFFKAAAGLSHLYVGFATLVETAIGDQASQ